MTEYGNEFTPEDVDEQIEQHMPFTTHKSARLIGSEGSAHDRLIGDLQLLYRQGAPRAISEDDAQSLQNAWQRVKMVAAEKKLRRNAPQHERDIAMLHIYKKKSNVVGKRHNLLNRLGVLVAACVALMVVGSMILLFNSMNSTRQAKTTTQVSAGTAHPSPAVTTTPGFRPTVTNSQVTLSKDVGKNVYTWNGQQHGQVDSIYSLAWSPDSKRIASASLNVAVWDATTGSNGVSLNSSGGGGSVLAVHWSPDGKYLASVHGGQIQIWDLVTNGIVRTLTYPGVSSVALTNQPFSKMSASSYLGSYQQLGGDTVINDFAWSPDGKRLVAASPFANGNSSMVIWDLASQQAMTLTGHTDLVAHVAWSADGKYIASTSYDSTVRVWDAKTGKNIYTHNAPNSRDAAALAWAPKNGDERLLVGYNSGSIESFDATNGAHTIKYSAYMSSVSSVAWSPNGKVVAAAGDGVKLLDANKDALLFTYTGNAGRIRSMAWSPNGKYIATGDDMNEGGPMTNDVKVWIAQ